MLSLAKSQIKFLTKLKDKSYRDENQLFLGYGQNLIALIPPDSLKYAVVKKSDYFYFLAKIEEKKLYVVPDNDFERIARVATDIIFVVRYFQLPLPDSIDKIVVAEDIQDPRNLAAIIRSALAFGYGAVLTSKSSVDLYHHLVVSTSAGAIFKIPVMAGDLVSQILKYKAQGFKVIASDLKKEDTYHLIPKNSKHILILGNEGHGISAKLSDISEFNVMIKINGIDSLNVSVASGIIMYMLGSNDAD
jgi:TrmH family RNA methyltransferase